MYFDRTTQYSLNEGIRFVRHIRRRAYGVPVSGLSRQTPLREIS
jgi:hypothetical protein